MQNASSTEANSAQEEMQFAPFTECNLPLAITKEVKSIKNKPVEEDLDIVSVVDYLNKKVKKEFKASSKATERLVKARYREGYKLNDLKKVIDLKVKDWLNDAHWHKFLRPSTLFNATNFENYLEETREEKPRENSSAKRFELDFSKGED